MAAALPFPSAPLGLDRFCNLLYREQMNSGCDARPISLASGASWNAGITAAGRENHP